MNNHSRLLSGIVVGGVVLIITSYIVYLVAINYERYLTRQLNVDWLSRTSLLSPDEVPMIEWEEDSLSSNGIESFVLLDEDCDDIKYLVHTRWPLTIQSYYWWKSRLGDDYFFTNKQGGKPKYYVEKTDTSLHVITSAKKDSWVYLPAVEPQPYFYALDFDYYPAGEQYETLQIDVRLRSLANRLKFVIRYNKDVKFDMYIQSNALAVSSDNRWAEFIKPLTLPKDRFSHIRMEAIGDIYSLVVNEERILSVRVENSAELGNYWCLMSWNGFGGGTACELEIRNFKILHTSITNGCF